MKKVLTLKRLLFATLIFIVLNLIHILLDLRLGLNPFRITPGALRFWSKDLGLVAAWIFYFLEKRKIEP